MVLILYCQEKMLIFLVSRKLVNIAKQHFKNMGNVNISKLR